MSTVPITGAVSRVYRGPSASSTDALDLASFLQKPYTQAELAGQVHAALRRAT
jgi:hypothetical protein